MYCTLKIIYASHQVTTSFPPAGSLCTWIRQGGLDMEANRWPGDISSLHLVIIGDCEDKIDCQDIYNELLKDGDKGVKMLAGITALIAKFMGPIWGRQGPGGPHVGPWTLLSGCSSMWPGLSWHAHWCSEHQKPAVDSMKQKSVDREL